MALPDGAVGLSAVCDCDHEIISTVVLLSSTDSFKKGCVSYSRQYVHEVLVKRFFKHAQEKSVVR